MLTHSVRSQLVQPKSATARHTRRLLGATCSALMVLAAILLPLALPAGSAAAASGSGAWPWPLLGEVITSYKNGSDPYAAGQHRGLDIAAPAGSPVLAIVGGRVTFSGKLPDGGETVTVASSDGAWLVSVLQLSERAVSRGASVQPGDRLGSVGTTGRRSVTQPHLHLGVRRSGTRAYVDPLSLLGAPRLPSVARPADPPASVQAKPAAPAARADRVRVTPLERAARQSHSVHAQSSGDATPAHRHGAQTGSTTARGSAGARAREGHAADQATSRVAPPPLKINSRSVETSVESRPAHAAESASTAESESSPSRWLLGAIAAVCLLALVMRRRPRSRALEPGGTSPETADEETGEVIAIAGRRRSA